MATIKATFDGEVFRPTAPVDLPPGTEVDVRVLHDASLSFIDTALGLELEGPADWSENFDAYLAAIRASEHG